MAKEIYEKGFWVIISFIITLSVAVAGFVNSEISHINNIAEENKFELASRFDAIKNDIPEIEKTVMQNKENLLIICTSLDIDCIRG